MIEDRLRFIIGKAHCVSDLLAGSRILKVDSGLDGLPGFIGVAGIVGIVGISGMVG